MSGTNYNNLEYKREGTFYGWDHLQYTRESTFYEWETATFCIVAVIAKRTINILNIIKLKCENNSQDKLYATRLCQTI